MIRYVPMNEKHIEGMAQIEEQCFNSGFAQKTFEKELENKFSIYVVAEEDEKVLGYAGLWDVCGEADIINVGVHKDFRRRGIAYGMLEKLVKICDERDVSVINLEVRTSNIAARELYKKLGFSEFGIRKGYYDGKEDAVLMRIKKAEELL